jgi:hypothetical protein
MVMDRIQWRLFCKHGDDNSDFLDRLEMIIYLHRDRTGNYTAQRTEAEHSPEGRALLASPTLTGNE